jgi:hypothetical protein
MTTTQIGENAAVSKPARVYRADWKAWFTDWGQRGELLSIIPPGAKLSANSNISADLCGKVPGQKNSDGTWGGTTNWAKLQMTEARAKRAHRDGASVGHQGRIFPGLDSDVSNPSDAETIQKLAFDVFGPAPARGREGSARRLFMYQIADGETPIGKVRLAWKHSDDAPVEAVEILGKGRYYNADGIHPSGKPYTWDTHPLQIGAVNITRITHAQVSRFFGELNGYIDLMGYVRVGASKDGAAGTRKKVGDTSLLAPSPEHVLEILKACPNNEGTHEGFVRLLAAIKGALV